jgi:DNA-binding CsgD family transcriptional regulator/tetratricopeptide (TPR) repeat protein
VIVRPVLCRAFVGRRRELAYLHERRLEAGRSHGGLVLIAGDAGIGKSRLLSEFCTSLAYSRWKVGRGACLEFASRPYGPILEVLNGVATEPFALGSAESKREQFEAIAEAFARAASRSAILIAVEDLHWADAATLDVLAYIGPKLQRMRALVVASVRAEDLHPDHPAIPGVERMVRAARAARIELGPLQGSDLQAFIDDALEGIDLPERTRRAIAAAGDGNPFFTEELLKSAVERRADRDVTSLPPTVRATLMERLRPLDDYERRVVGQAAVIGRTFGLELLAETLDTSPDRVLPALRRARDFQLVEEAGPDAFRFRHGLTREAIYGEFLGAEVRPRHRTIAATLERADAPQPLEALAYHWWAARDALKAAAYNVRAGDGAVAVHAHEDAIAFYERALECETDAAERGAIVKKIADRRLAMGWTREAQATYDAAAGIYRCIGAHEREASCRAAAAITGYGIGLRDPTAPLEAMLARLDASEYLARSRAHLGIAWLAATFWFPTRAAEHLASVDSRALAEAPDIALRFHNVAAFVAMTQGDLVAFRREHAAWVEAAQASGTLQNVAGAYTNGAMCRSFFGLHEEAQEDLDRALRLAQQAHNVHCEEMVHAFAALCCLMRGDLVQARSELGRVSPASENRVNITFATAWGTVVGAALGDRELIETWFDGFEMAVARAPEVECGGGFAEIMVRRGRPADAAEFLRRALPECELLRGNVITLLAIARYGSAGERTRARTYLERASGGTVEMVERPALALFDAILTLQNGDSGGARALARIGAEGFRRLRFPLFEAQALEIAGDTAAAADLFRRCGAVHDARRLERASGVAPRQSQEPAEALSSREREIAELAASGRSNLEIARRLSISHKTVEKHLGCVYQKLHISSRAQLSAFVESIGGEARRA